VDSADFLATCLLIFALAFFGPFVGLLAADLWPGVGRVYYGADGSTPYQTGVFRAPRQMSLLSREGHGRFINGAATGLTEGLPSL